MANIRNETGNITTDSVAIKRIITEYYKQLYTRKFENLDKMDQLLEKHKLPKLTQHETENLNSTITMKEIDSVILSLP